MEISFRDAATVLHGMGFGAVLLLLFSGGAVAIYTLAFSPAAWRPSRNDDRLLRLYFLVMALLAWLTVLAGAYIIYPWYRAHPPANATDLTSFPKALLMSDPATSGWHDIGMEWKEHVAWFAPICLTTAAYLVARYGAHLRYLKGIRNGLVGLMMVALFAAAVAGFFGAMLNKFAPVRGGGLIVLMKGEAHDK